MTPTADALKGLVGAVRQVADRGCIELPTGGSVPCDDCDSCDSSAALSAFEGRARLRDDEAFMEMLKGRIFGGPTGLEHLADAIESALLGTPGTGDADDGR